MEYESSMAKWLVKIVKYTKIEIKSLISIQQGNYTKELQISAKSAEVLEDLSNSCLMKAGF